MWSGLTVGVLEFAFDRTPVSETMHQTWTMPSPGHEVPATCIGKVNGKVFLLAKSFQARMPPWGIFQSSAGSWYASCVLQRTLAQQSSLAHGALVSDSIPQICGSFLVKLIGRPRRFGVSPPPVLLEFFEVKGP